MQVICYVAGFHLFPIWFTSHVNVSVLNSYDPSLDLIKNTMLGSYDQFFSQAISQYCHSIHKKTIISHNK